MLIGAEDTGVHVCKSSLATILHTNITKVYKAAWMSRLPAGNELAKILSPREKAIFKLLLMIFLL